MTGWRWPPMRDRALSDKYKQIPPYLGNAGLCESGGPAIRRGSAGGCGRNGNVDAAEASAGTAVPAPGDQAPVAKPVEERHPKLEQFVDENGRLHLRTVE